MQKDSVPPPLDQILLLLCNPDAEGRVWAIRSEHEKRHRRTPSKSWSTEDATATRERRAYSVAVVRRGLTACGG